MNKKVALLNSDITDTIKKYFENKDVDVTEIKSLDYISEFDLIITDNYKNELPDKIINIHSSLLPAYNCDNPAEQAFMDGVKVSGITLHSKDKIIAQYPVLIGVGAHYDEFLKDMRDVKKRLVPAVIEAILEDRVFDFSDLFRNPCSHGCSGCGKCN